VPLPNPAELTGDPVSIETTWPLISLPSSSVLSSDSLKPQKNEFHFKKESDAIMPHDSPHLSFEFALDKATPNQIEQTAKLDRILIRHHVSTV
jgi:hypothetical protein